MKTKEELENLKNEVSALRDRLSALSSDELAEVIGGGANTLPPGNVIKEVPPAGDVPGSHSGILIGSSKGSGR